MSNVFGDRDLTVRDGPEVDVAGADRSGCLRVEGASIDAGTPYLQGRLDDAGRYAIKGCPCADLVGWLYVPATPRRSAVLGRPRLLETDAAEGRLELRRFGRLSRHKVRPRDTDGNHPQPERRPPCSRNESAGLW
jgi:hypothetical protein